MSKLFLEKNNGDRGQSIIEVIIAIIVFVLIGRAITILSISSFDALTQGGEHTQAIALAQEGIEAVKNIQNRAWNEISYSTSSVSVSGNKWIFDGEGTTETIGQYDRIISFDDVCRDSLNNILDCPGSYVDPYSKKVTSSIEWIARRDIGNSINQTTYLTNWDSQEWIQTDWFNGSGQSIWTDTSRYESSNNISISTSGQISLTSNNIQDGGFDFGTSSNFDWPFDTGSNYNYDTEKIEVTGSYSQLVSTGGSSASGNTLNEDFTSNANSWSFNLWDINVQEVTSTGSWQSSGGNPSGYIDINIPSNAWNDEVGGYWEQSIDITENGAVVTCSFDWIINQWVAIDGVDDYQFYVFLDDFSGAPTIGSEVWSSSTQGSTTGWSGQQNVNCSLVASTSGTYYYKIAVWLDTSRNNDTGPITAGYDNAKVYWEKTDGGSYSSDSPSIYPNLSYNPAGVLSWDSFTETASKNGGEIYHQLSIDNGDTWQYWNGSSWTAAGASDYNIASIINSNIGSFGTSTNQVNFKSFLKSDGSQFVQLDNINIAFSAPPSVWTFGTWDIGIPEVTPIGNQYSSGGNPSGYVDITIPMGVGDHIGGYWEQSFTTYKNNPTGAIIDFDYKVIDFNGNPNVADVRIYIDNSSGDPINQAGSSINISGEGSWISADQIDISSTLTTAGTYYLKVAFWLETPILNNGPFTIGFDNIGLDLGDGNCAESGTLTSSSYNMTDNSPVQIIGWDEIEPLNCDIKFQIRTAPDSGGSPGTWTDWYGATGSGGYFIDSIGTLVSVDLNGNQWVQYKAELLSDGTDTPILEEVRINYKQ